MPGIHDFPDHTPTMLNSLLFVALLCAGVASPTQAGTKQAAKRRANTVDHSTPQKLSASFLKAMGRRDWKAGFACVTPESQDLMNGMYVLMASPVIARSKQRKTHFQELLEDHGVETTTPAKVTEFGFFMKDQGRTFGAVKQKTAFFQAIRAWTMKHGEKGRDGKPQDALAPMISGVQLVDFNVRGERATARVMRNGRKSNIVIDFRRVKGNWYGDFVASFQRIVHRSSPAPKRRREINRYTIAVHGTKGVKLRLLLITKPSASRPPTRQSRIVTVPFQMTFKAKSFHAWFDTLKDGKSGNDGDRVLGNYKTNGTPQGGGFGGTIRKNSQKTFSFGNL